MDGIVWNSTEPASEACRQNKPICIIELYIMNLQYSNVRFVTELR